MLNHKYFRLGMTLIEVLTVIMILILVMTVVLPFVSGSDGLKVKMAAQIFQNNLELARSEAIRRGRDVTVNFTTGGNTVTLTAPNVHTGAIETIDKVNLAEASNINDLTIGEADTGEAQDVAYTPDGGTYSGGSTAMWTGGMIYVELGGSSGLIFKTDGTVTNAEHGQLEAGNSVEVSSGDQSSSIYINPVTGIVTIN